MKPLGLEEIAQYLGILQGLRPCYPFFDVHVHPYEVLFDRFAYTEDLTVPGVLNLAGKSYTSPAVTRFHFPEMGDFNDDPRSQRLQDISIMLLRKVYGSVGEQVFADQMTLSGIDKVLLLPVASATCTPEQFDSRMRWIRRYYRNDEKFLIAGSVPGCVDASEIGAYVFGLKREFGIKAVKCHPVVTGIDLGESAKRVWLEELIATCGVSGLPLSIHGGRNNPYWGGPRGDFAALDHFKDIDFSLSQKPVILAHAGFHRCSTQEIEQNGLKTLEGMLGKNSNLYVDISGLTLEPLKLVLQAVDPTRILFGSDALYSSQWEAVILTLHALRETGLPVEESFIQYASINPRNTIFKEDDYARHIKDQVESVSGRSEGEVVPGSI